MISVWFIEGGPQLLKGMNPKVAKIAAERLHSLGVNIRLNSRITKVTPTSIIINDNIELPTKTTIWTGGIKSAPISFLKNIACDDKGRVVVGERLNLEIRPEVFVIGDAACITDPETGKPMPQTAQVAIHQAKYASRMLPRILEEREIPSYKPKRNWPYIIPLSGKFAIMVYRGKFWYGFFPYVMRRLADLRYFLTILPLFKALAFWIKGSVVYIKND